MWVRNVVRYVQPLCCADYEPYAIDPGGQHGQTRGENPLENDCVVSPDDSSGNLKHDKYFETDHLAPDGPRRLGCQNFYARGSGEKWWDIVTTNHDETSANGLCNYKYISKQGDLSCGNKGKKISGHPYEQKKHDGLCPSRETTRDCYAMLGSKPYKHAQFLDNARKKNRPGAARQAVIKLDLSLIHI